MLSMAQSNDGTKSRVKYVARKVNWTGPAHQESLWVEWLAAQIPKEEEEEEGVYKLLPATRANHLSQGALER